jgi:hypothetical protein
MSGRCREWRSSRPHLRSAIRCGVIPRRLPSGKVSFGYQYQRTGNCGFKSLGILGAVTVDQARKGAMQAAAAVIGGVNPVALSIPSPHQICAVSRVHPSPTDARWRLSSEISRATHRRAGERPHSPLYGRFEIGGCALRELNGGLLPTNFSFDAPLHARAS